MKTRMSIALPPAPQRFFDDALDVTNAMRAIVHHSLAGTGTVETIDGGVVQRTAQGVTTLVRDDYGLTLAYEPDHSIAQGFAPAIVRLPRREYPESPLWTAEPNDLVAVFAHHAARLVNDGIMTGYQVGSGQDECIVVLEAGIDDADRKAEELLEDLSNGTDVIAGNGWSIRRGWPAFGTPGLIHPMTASGVRYRTPGEDEPDPSRRMAGFRIRLMESVIRRMPPAVIIMRGPDGTYEIVPYSLTRQRPSAQDAEDVRRKGVEAYHRLNTIEQARSSNP